jgi:hypothetical protein
MNPVGASCGTGLQEPVLGALARLKVLIMPSASRTGFCKPVPRAGDLVP